MYPKDYQNKKAGKAILTSTGYWAFLPSPLPPKIQWSSDLINVLSAAERDLSQLATLASAFPFQRLLIQPFIRNEAVISSRIEGTHASLVDLYTYETAQLSYFEKTDDVREVYNYVRAMDYGLERLATLPVSLRLIRELHTKLMENVRGGSLSPGEFRRSQNWIGVSGSTPTNAQYVPPPVDEMMSALNEMEKFLHRDTEIPALVKTGMIHYQFEAIHPFLDGNGRVGRLLIDLLLCEWGLLQQPVLNLSAYIERYRQEYYDLLLGISQMHAWEAWLRFFLRGVSEQARIGVGRMQNLQEIRNKYQIIEENDRNSIRMAVLLDYIFTRPILTVKQTAADLHIPFKTVADYFVKLESANVLREITGYARNRIYQADEVLKAIQLS